MAPLCAITPCLISACLQPSDYPSCNASGNAGSVRTREYTCALRKGLSLSRICSLPSSEKHLRKEHWPDWMLKTWLPPSSPSAKNVGSDRKHRNIAQRVFKLVTRQTSMKGANRSVNAVLITIQNWCSKHLILCW